MPTFSPSQGEKSTNPTITCKILINQNQVFKLNKKSFPAKEIQRELGHNRYQPIWEMAHKIGSVMGLRDDRYRLGNVIWMMVF